MLGLINKGLEDFIIELRGQAEWARICSELGFEESRFEALINYPPDVTDKLLDACAHALNLEKRELLDDFGTFITVGERGEVLRKFLRIGGANYRSFLFSLPRLMQILRASIPGFQWPHLKLHHVSACQFELYESDFELINLVFLGILRAMADEYKALISIKLKQGDEINKRFDIYEITIHGDIQ